MLFQSIISISIASMPDLRTIQWCFHVREYSSNRASSLSLTKTGSLIDVFLFDETCVHTKFHLELSHISGTQDVHESGESFFEFTELSRGLS